MRYELVEGQVVAMAPPRPVHARMIVRLGYVLEGRFSPPCNVYAEAGVLHPDDVANFRIPDLVISCVPPESRWIADPTIVVEVISPSNDRQDILEKLAFYRALPSLRQILMVWPERRRVELHTREQDFWAVRTYIGTSTFDLSGSERPITLDELYRPLDL
jgi:Uma2 family endonuclease